MSAKYILIVLPLLLTRGADEDFIKKASEANMAEIEASQLATEKGESAAMKAFADSMVVDHGIAQRELLQIAKKEGVSLSRSPDEQHGRMIEHLSRLSGRVFDSIYMNMQLLDHQAEVGLFQRESNGGKDPMAKSYAEKYLPQLRHHLMMASAVAKVLR